MRPPHRPSRAASYHTVSCPSTPPPSWRLPRASTRMPPSGRASASANSASSKAMSPSAPAACWNPTSTSSAGPRSASATKSPPARCWAPTRWTRTFSGERSYLRIGNGNKIREHYTISRGTAPESVTEIGDENYIMTSGHIAHNCKIGSRTVIASCALVAGYVEVEDQAFISGGVVVHQYLQDRPAGHDRRQHAREQRRAAVLPVLRFQRGGQGTEPRGAEARRLQSLARWPR